MAGAYENLHAAGLQYGPAFQVLTSSWLSTDGQGLADLQSWETRSSLRDEGWHTDPSMLDGSMQLGAIASSANGSSDQSTRVPAALSAYLVSRPHSHCSRAWATASSESPSSSTGGAAISHHRLVHDSGLVYATLHRLEARVIARHDAAQAEVVLNDVADGDSCLYVVKWQTSNPSVCASSQSVALPLSDSASWSVRTGSDGSRSFWRSGRGSPAAEASTLLGVMQQSVLVDRDHNLMLVSTRGASLSSDGVVSPSSNNLSFMYGMLRSLVAEHPNVVGGSMNVSRASPDSLSGTLLEGEDVSPFGARISSGRVRVAQLVRAGASHNVYGNMQLVPVPRGSLESLRPSGVPEPAEYRAGQLGISIRSVGVNFRDVLNVLGMYPGDPGAPGSDFAGIVASLHGEPGSHDGLAVGDRVFGLAVGCLGTFAYSVSNAVAPMPSNIGFEDACTLPTVYVTVEMAMSQAAGVVPHEDVLVHATAGGVGLAALAVLQLTRARVLATAGGPSKRHLLRQRAVQWAVGSRDTAFVESGSQMSGGLGYSVVLNSLTSTGMVAASISGASHGARFVEIGKRDIWSARRAAMERGDLSFNLVALDFAPPSIIRAALHRVASAMHLALLTPLHTSCWRLSDVNVAMRVMAQARHTGKIVVRSETPRQLLAGERMMVTGGVGALGTLVADWMSSTSVTHIQLLGRSGRWSSGASLSPGLVCGDRVALVQLERCDVSCSEEASWSTRSSSRQALAVIMHAGGVLRDALLDKQTAGSVREVFAPKQGGLWRMSLHSDAMAVRVQSLFSSISSALGSGGQTNYSGANALLDGVAHADVSRGTAAPAVP